MLSKKCEKIYTNKNIIKPNKLLGQNFLRDKNILRKIIAAAGLTKNDTVLEVGPGEGTLTEELAQASGRIIAVEKDRNLVPLLKEKFRNTENVEIIEGDILKFVKDLPLYKRGIEGDLKNAEKILPNPPFIKEGKIQYKVVANIPYYLTSHLIRLLLESTNPPLDMVLMLQKEVAQRICARPPRMSLLAVSVQFYATPQIIARVPKGAFWPKPKVDSAIIRITPLSCHPEHIRSAQYKLREGSIKDSSATPQNDKSNSAKFFRVLHAGFSHPRKQLLNNLSVELKIPREQINKILQTAGLAPSQRAETLSVEDWIKLALATFSKKSRK